MQVLCRDLGRTQGVGGVGLCRVPYDRPPSIPVEPVCFLFFVPEIGLQSQRKALGCVFYFLCQK